MDNVYHLEAPLSIEDIEFLKIGDRVAVSGYIYTARDAAHQRFLKLIKEGKELPIPIEGQIIYYVGPTPAPPGRVIGAAGATTSYRMDPYSPALLEMGLKGMIGKGRRSDEVKEAMVKYKAIYMASVGGAAALMSRSIKEASVVAYAEMGPEAVMKLKVDKMPAIVVNDIFGNDLYKEGKKKYRIS